MIVCGVFSTPTAHASSTSLLRCLVDRLIDLSDSPIEISHDTRLQSAGAQNAIHVPWPSSPASTSAQQEAASAIGSALAQLQINQR
jgi:hypothetical protein